MPLPQGTRPFDRLALELATDQLAANPTLASSLGLTEYDELLPDLSAEAIASRERSDDEWLTRLEELPDAELDADERIDRELVTMTLRGRRVLRDWADWRRSPDHYAAVALSGVFVLLLNRLRPEPELAAAVAARLRATPALLKQGIANLDASFAHSALIRRALGQVTAGVLYSRAVAAEIDDEAGRADVAEAGEQAAVAFEAFGAHLERLVETATGDWAIGEERYDALLRTAEGLAYGARGLRERGQRAYDELAQDMSKRSRQLRGHEDWRRVLTELSQDRPNSPEEMLELYREATAAARAFCVEQELVTFPAGERCDVVPSAPFSRSMLAVAHYAVPPPFAPGNHAGHFFVPYPPDSATPDQVAARLETNNRHGLWSIAVHEAYPGHHWHFAWLAANGFRPLRAVFGSAYFVEGWGLYAEELLREKGFFRTPEQELCQRDFRLFRAARMIVDTSLHLGEMTIEEAVDFMSTKASLSRETAQAEVLRYCAWPTQAPSYLTGALELDRLRERWLGEDRGTLRDFHDRATASGRLPISLVEKALFG
jgi:uncharacterized protein (DUF885 family)